MDINLKPDGRRVIVADAAGRPGRAFALDPAGAGAEVIVAEVNIDGLEETRDLIGAMVGTAHIAPLNVTCTPSCRALAHIGGVDVLVNGAAGFGGLKRAPFMETDEEDRDKAMEVDVKGLLKVARAIAPIMVGLARARSSTSPRSWCSRTRPNRCATWRQKAP